jgi:hypothetical protein
MSISTIRAATLSCLLALAGATQAATLAATPATFAGVLTRAHGGDVLKLAPGTYEGLAPKGWAFAPGLTITSADPAHRAVLTNFDAHNIKGVTFSNLELLAKGPAYFAFQVFDSTDVHFDRVNVHGVVEEGRPRNDAEGIRFSGGSSVSVTNSEFHDVKRAFAIGDTEGVTVSGNRAHDLQVTGFMFGGATTHITVTDNTVWNIRPMPGDHPDAIQFLTAGSKAPATDILVARNVVFRGEGAATQGIFFRDQVGTLPFERVTITDNLIVGTGYNGILVMGAKDLAVTGNELISNPGSTNNTWLRVETAQGVTASRNRAQLISFDQSTKVKESGNRLTSPVSDRGLAALRDWAATHPERAAAIADMLARLGR